MKILIIEDDLIMTLVLTRILNNFNYEVICAKDGKEGIELINVTSPDVVITDLMLPFVSGPAIVSYVKQMPGKRIPVILLSSMPLGLIEKDHNKYNADSYLLKPVCPEELKITIEELSGVEFV